jgi:hypothetical protein
VKPNSEKQCYITNHSSMAVKIKRTPEAIILTLPSTMEIYDIQSLINRFNVLEIMSRSKAKPEHLAELTSSAKKNWSPEMKERLSKMDEFKDLF